MADTPTPEAPDRPDPGESLNVSRAHAARGEAGAAVTREKRIEESGREPVPLWILLACGVVLLIGGGVMGAGGRLFDYSPHYEGYVRADFEAGGRSGPVTDTIMNALMRRGAKVYSKCTGCHQSNGQGAPGVAPPLAGSDWVTGNTERLSMIILFGLQGKITVKGTDWNLVMPSQMPLDQVELAAVMTYVRNSFGNETGDVVTPEQAANALALFREETGGAAFGPPKTEQILLEKHDRMLEGGAFDPGTMVDLETLEPVEEDGGGEEDGEDGEDGEAGDGGSEAGPEAPMDVPEGADPAAAPATTE